MRMRTRRPAYTHTAQHMQTHSRTRKWAGAERVQSKMGSTPSSRVPIANGMRPKTAPAAVNKDKASVVKGPRPSISGAGTGWR